MTTLRFSRLSRAAAVVAAALVVPTALSAGAASAAGGSTLTHGTCSRSSVVSLQLQHSDPGRIAAGFEVDKAPMASVWRVRLTHDGTSYVAARRTAKAPGATFSVDRVVADRAGADTFSGTATNLATGEVCTVSASI